MDRRRAQGTDGISLASTTTLIAGKKPDHRRSLLKESSAEYVRCSFR